MSRSIGGNAGVQLANNFRSSYNQYLAIAARVIRKSLKDDLRIKAERRDNFDLKFTKWEVRQLLDGNGKLGD